MRIESTFAEKSACASDGNQLARLSCACERQLRRHSVGGAYYLFLGCNTLQKATYHRLGRKRALAFLNYLTTFSLMTLLA